MLLLLKQCCIDESDRTHQTLQVSYVHILRHGLQQWKKPSNPHAEICKEAVMCSRVPGGHKGTPYSSGSSCRVKCSSGGTLTSAKAHQNSKMVASHWPAGRCVLSPIPYCVCKDSNLKTSRFSTNPNPIGTAPIPGEFFVRIQRYDWLIDSKFNK